MDSANLRFYVTATSMAAGTYEMVLVGTQSTYIHYEVPFRIFIHGSDSCVTEAITMTPYTDNLFSDWKPS